MPLPDFRIGFRVVPKGLKSAHDEVRKLALPEALPLDFVFVGPRNDRPVQAWANMLAWTTFHELSHATQFPRSAGHPVADVDDEAIAHTPGLCVPIVGFSQIPGKQDLARAASVLRIALTPELYARSFPLLLDGQIQRFHYCHAVTAEAT